jgi:hypothetical protein
VPAASADAADALVELLGDGTRISAQDRFHLNGIAMEEGKPRYVTAMVRDL